MPVAPGMHNLLVYDAKHSVLICRECQYAIQKSALGSHLLRHKIYRGERQRLLSSIAQLELLEPDDVQLPLAGSRPVDGLPIIAGFRCTAPDCDNLCASTKRMRRHWSERHNMSDPPDSFARSVNLQTFFRGTKIRYFEVALPRTAAEKPIVSSDETVAQQQGLMAVPSSSVETSILPPGPLRDLDLELLRYMHHFTTATSLTLPVENHESAKHWQVDVVAQALQLRWLMCGVLAISSSHLAALSDDETAKRVHQDRSTQLLQEFSAGWGETSQDSDAVAIEDAKVAAQMICIQRCFSWTPESPAIGEGILLNSTPFQLQVFTTTIQGCVDRNLALRSAVSSGYMPEETVVQASDDLGRSPGAGVPRNIPLVLLERLRSLPYRMTEALGKPDSTMDVFATLSAIDALVECYSLSYASNGVGAVWMGMESWLRRLSDHFNRMMWRLSPAALIVLAHWSILVKRAEHYCWFLKGSATNVLRQITRDLPQESAIQRLIENLLG
jgi:hypothetical protein